MLYLNNKDMQYIEIYLPWNLEVNLITHFGVIALFHQFFYFFFLLFISKMSRDRC